MAFVSRLQGLGQTRLSHGDLRSLWGDGHPDGNVLDARNSGLGLDGRAVRVVIHSLDRNGRCVHHFDEGC